MVWDSLGEAMKADIRTGHVLSLNEMIIEEESGG